MSEVASPWPGPKGLIPVTSGKADDANLYARAYLDAIHVEMRVLDAVEPDLTTEIFGETFASPIMTPAFSHLNKVGEDGRTPMEEYGSAAAELGLANWVGMEPDDVYERILGACARTVRIIKPFADHDLIREQIAFAEEHGSLAVGIDIDHVPGADGHYDVVDGIPLGTITTSDLREYARSTSLPFVAKGVLSVQDALKAQEAGCAAIFVSHHHGRIPYGVAPLQVLPRIKEAVADSGMSVFVDCSIDTGYDAYKALALGADAVAVGRGILRPLLKEGKDGVVGKIDKMNQELARLMMFTDVPNTGAFDPSVLYL